MMKAATSAAPSPVATAALSCAEAATIISQAARRPVTHRAVSGAQLRARLAEAGVPERYAALLAALDEAIENGAEDRVTPTVRDVTGRPPKSLADFATENAPLWR